MINCGKLLNEAKSQVKHGDWLNWLRDHAKISPRTASNYMRIANGGSNEKPLAPFSVNFPVLAMWTPFWVENRLECRLDPWQRFCEQWCSFCFAAEHLPPYHHRHV